MLDWSQLQKKISWLLIPAAAVLMLAIYIFNPQEKPETVQESSFNLTEAESPQQTETPETQNPIQETMIVEVKGLIAKPGVYEMQPGARIKDAIDAAGGFLPDAESRAINLAMKIQDEMSIYVPAIGEEIVMPESPAAVGGDSGTALIDINNAEESQLTELPGIGPSKAAAIISYRTENGKFQTIEDLKNVTGIGDKTFEQLKDAITAK